jgi:flagellar biogenesis protein FliO
VSPLAQYVAQTGVTLLGVALVAWLLIYASKRVGLPRDDGVFKLRGRLALDGRRALYLVQVADRVLVLGASEAGVTKLAEFGGDVLPAASKETARSFSQVLARVVGGARVASSAPEETDERAAVASATSADPAAKQQETQK